MINETKKKLKGTCDMGDKAGEERLWLKASMAVIVDGKWKSSIKCYEYISDRIVTVGMEISRGNIMLDIRPQKKDDITKRENPQSRMLVGKNEVTVII